MSRHAIEREENIISKKWKIKKLENRKIAKSKKQKTKSRKRNFAGNFELWKTHRGSKDDVIFPPASTVEKSGLIQKMPRSDGTSDVRPYISPLMHPPYMKRLSPSLPDGPSFF
jgi:hypothetical protein